MTASKPAAVKNKIASEFAPKMTEISEPPKRILT